MKLKTIVNLSVALISLLAALLYYLVLWMPDAMPAKEAFSKVIELGPVGDYVGGILNPVISLLALIWLSQSFLAQKQELNETKKALADSADSARIQVRISALSALLGSTTQRIAMLESRRNTNIQMFHQDAINDGGSEKFSNSLLDTIASTNKEIEACQKLENTLFEKLQDIMRDPALAPTPDVSSPKQALSPDQQQPDSR